MSKKVLITGVHKGLGNALAAHYLGEGYAVTGISRRQPQSLVNHPAFRFVPMDLLKLTENAALQRALFKEDGPYALVYLNAGILGAIDWMDAQSMDDIHRLMDINVWANKVLLDALKNGAPDTRQIIAISSGAANIGSCGWGPYSISKAALNCLIRIHADEWPQCHMTSLAPGLVGTDILDEVFDREPNASFPADAILRESRDKGLIQAPEATAKRIAQITAQLREGKSGQYRDIRDIN